MNSNLKRKALASTMVDEARTDRCVDAAARLTCSPYIPPRPPRFLSSPTPASLTALLHNSHNLRSALVLKHALEWAVVHADNALLGWLMALSGDLVRRLACLADVRLRRWTTRRHL